MDKKEYAEYLKTEHWQEARAAALERADNHCTLCGNGGELHVHHNTYDRLGEEIPSDVVVLCHDCHSIFHRIEDRDDSTQKPEGLNRHTARVFFTKLRDSLADDLKVGKLSSNEYLILVYMIQKADKNTGITVTNARLLSVEMGVNKKTVNSILTSLKRKKRIGNPDGDHKQLSRKKGSTRAYPVVVHDALVIAQKRKGME